MTPLQSRIMARLRACRDVQTADELADALQAPLEDVTEALHELQDTSDVLLRNGFYKASPLHWARRGGAGMKWLRSLTGALRVRRAGSAAGARSALQHGLTSLGTASPLVATSGPAESTAQPSRPAGDVRTAIERRALMMSNRSRAQAARYRAVHMTLSRGS